MMRIFLLILFTTFLFNSPILVYAKSDIEVTVINIHDGDSITVLTKKKQKLKIRLDGIDAPELKQRYGKQSRVHLVKLIGSSKVVTLNKRGKDTYGRTLGVIYADGVEINAKMVEDGYAWSYRAKYNPDSRLGLLERNARNEKLGLWADDKKPVAPWEYRKNEREYNYEYSKPLIKSPIEGVAICINMQTNEISYYIGGCPPKHKALIK